MKNILLICSKFPPQKDGLSAHTFELAREMAKENTVTLLTSTEIPLISIENLIIVPIISKWNFISLFKYFRLHKEFELIIFQYLPFLYRPRGGINFQIVVFLLYIKYFKKTSINTIIHELYFPFQYSFKSIVMHVCHKLMLLGVLLASTKAFFSTKRFLNESTSLLPYIKNKLIFKPIVGSSINSSENFDSTSFKNKYNLNDNDITLCLFGPPHPSKDYKFIINSIYQINQNSDCKIKLLFMGTTLTELNNLEYFNFNLEEFITATGRISDQEVIQGFNSSTALLSYFTDGLSARRSSVISALSNGATVISSKSIYTEEIFEKCENIYLFSSAPKKFYNQLEELLINQTIKRDKEISTKFYKDNFSWKKIIKNIVDIN